MATASASNVSFYSTRVSTWRNTDRDAADGTPERGAFDEMQKFLVEILRC